METGKIYRRKHGSRSIYVLLLDDGYIFVEFVASKTGKKTECFFYRSFDEITSNFFTEAKEVTLDEITNSKEKECIERAFRGWL